MPDVHKRALASSSAAPARSALGAPAGEKNKELDRYRPLRPDIAQWLHDDRRVLLLYHSNTIEGNTLSLRETQLVIEYGLTVGGHSLREYLEATNHAATFAELVQHRGGCRALHGRRGTGPFPGRTPWQQW